MYGLSNGKRFSPDYLMFINDTKNKKLYYQCVFEVKGSHLEEKDEWKEKALREIGEATELSWSVDKEDPENTKEYQKYIDSVKQQGYDAIKNIGF
jgi:type III restriction enzyme